MVVIDKLYKSLCLIPLPGLPTAFETAQLILTMCSDTLEYQKILSVTMTPSSHHGYGLASWNNLQVNVLVERANQDLGCSYSLFALDTVTPMNFLHLSAMHLTPFQCVLSYQPSLFPWNATPTVDEWFRWSEQVWENTQQCLEQVAQWTKHFTDCHQGETPQYNLGD